jgi:hypothetical protein
MPCIVSDFPFFGGVGFNLPYCYESPSRAFVAEDAGYKRKPGQSWG